MNKAAELAKRLEALSVEQGFDLIEKCNKKALYFDVFDDTICIMHIDGSVNIIDSRGQGRCHNRSDSARKYPQGLAALQTL